jgi:hypothetical protein
MFKSVYKYFFSKEDNYLIQPLNKRSGLRTIAYIDTNDNDIDSLQYCSPNKNSSYSLRNSTDDIDTDSLQYCSPNKNSNHSLHDSTDQNNTPCNNYAPKITFTSINENYNKVDIVEDNILNYTTEYYVCHQCNCTGKNPKGLAKILFDEYPATNVYYLNTNRVPGTISIFNGKTKFQIEYNIINMYAQIEPGEPSKIDSNDTYLKRLEYFKNCLIELNKSLTSSDKVAFPYNIGCGLAKGKWEDYYKMIIEFKTWNPDREVIIVKLVQPNTVLQQ